MSGKLRDYQVLDVLCGGTFYKVKHKVTSKIFAWRACDCSSFSNSEIKCITEDVGTISKLQSGCLLHYYETILHMPSKTLYIVMEFNASRTLENLIEECEKSHKHITEPFIWHVLRELAKVCKLVAPLKLNSLHYRLDTKSIFVNETWHLVVDCFTLEKGVKNLIRSTGDVTRSLMGTCSYSQDLHDVIEFLTDLRSGELRSDAILYHPTVLSHLDIDEKELSEILVNNESEANKSDFYPIIFPNPVKDKTISSTKLSDPEVQDSSNKLSEEHSSKEPEINKCDSEKAVELCKAVEPLPRRNLYMDSPIYSNISQKKTKYGLNYGSSSPIKSSEKTSYGLSRGCSPTLEQGTYTSELATRGSLSPTLAALALELPGFVPRSRKPVSQALAAYKPHQISQDTLSNQWMSRLIALRQREESLNQRERDLIKKEIINSPNTKFIPLRSPERSTNMMIPTSSDLCHPGITNGITLPPVLPEFEKRRLSMLPEDKSSIKLPPVLPEFENRRLSMLPEEKSRVSRRRRRSSVRIRQRKMYEDLDSSLSADPGDSSMVVTAAKITAENMPRRNIFPENSSKKVHFTPVNPFIESDESVTLTFYELEHVDRDGYQVPRAEEKVVSDINKFKYLDLEKLTSEKRALMEQNHNLNHSPSKQPKFTKKTLCDITNTNDVKLKRSPSKSSLKSSNDLKLKRSPSKTSLTSKSSNSSRYSMASMTSNKSHWSMESAQSVLSKATTVSQTHESKAQMSKTLERPRASRQSMAAVPQTPAVEKKKRKSLLPFKTPFKFMTSAKIV